MNTKDSSPLMTNDADTERALDTRQFARRVDRAMGRFGGRGRGRGGGRGSRNDGPTLPRGMRDELELAATEKRSSGFEESDLGEKRGPGGARGDGGRGGRGGRGGKGTVLDRKQQRKLAKEREKAQRQQWSERKARVKARDGGGGGGAGDGRKTRDNAKRGADVRKRGRVDDHEDSRVSGKRAKKSVFSASDGETRAPSSSRKTSSDDAGERKKEPKRAKRADVSGDALRLAPKRLAPRMSPALLEAYKRDEAEQKRLLKRLKGRQKGPDDGLGGFFESLPGLELLAEDADAPERIRETALPSAVSRIRPKITLDSDEEIDSVEDDDPFGMGPNADDDPSDDDPDDDDPDDDDPDDDDPSDDEPSDDADEDDDDADDGEPSDDGVSAASRRRLGGAGGSGNAYVPPALRAAMAKGFSNDAKETSSNADARAAADADSARRRVRGLMNRMGEANVFSIVSGVAALASSLPRRAVGDAATEEALKALVDGPRASSQYAAVIATFVAGIAGALGPEAGARFGAALASKLDEARGIEGEAHDGSGSIREYSNAREVNARAASNLCAVLARLFVCGLFPSDVVWGFLTDATSRMSELDATLTLGVLRVAGPRTRAEDPIGMKRFVETLRERVANARSDTHQANADNETNGGSIGIMSRRARLMLQMVVDLKNNKRAVGADAGGAGGREGEDQWGFPMALSRLLKADAGVGDASIALRTLTYDKLRKDKASLRGQWWLPEAAGTEAWFAAREASRTAERGASAAAESAAAREAGEGAALLRKARAMRMNTESRRAVFCVVMGAEDFADALDGLARLPLAEAQRREIPRVLLECCLNETAYNPYYETLATKLCERSPKTHRLALQLSVWDHVRQVAPSVAEGRDDDANGFGEGFARTENFSLKKEPSGSARRVAHLARFVAGALVSGALAPTALKVVDFGGSEIDGAGSSPRARLFRRLLLQALLSCPNAKKEKALVVFQTLAQKGLGRGGEAGATRAALERALADEAFVTHGLSFAKEDTEKRDSAASVREAARQAGRILRGELA